MSLSSGRPRPENTMRPETRAETVMRSVSCRPQTTHKSQQSRYDQQYSASVICLVVCPRKINHENISLIKLAFQNSNAFVRYLSLLCVNITLSDRSSDLWWRVENVGLCFHSDVDPNNVMMMEHKAK